MVETALKLVPELKVKSEGYAHSEDGEQEIGNCEGLSRMIAEELEERRIPIIGKIDSDLNHMVETTEDIHDHYYVSENRDSRVGNKSREGALELILCLKSVIGQISQERHRMSILLQVSFLQWFKIILYLRFTIIQTWKKRELKGTGLCF